MKRVFRANAGDDIDQFVNWSIYPFLPSKIDDTNESNGTFLKKCKVVIVYRGDN